MSKQSIDKEVLPDEQPIHEKITQFLNPLCVLSTGSSPGSYKDMLVIGDLSREDYLDAFLDTNPVESADIQVVDDAAIIYTADRTKIGIAYHQVDEFEHHVRQIVAGQSIEPIHTTWSTGPWLPESYGADLARAMLLHDTDAKYEEILVQFKSYPSELRAAVIAYTRQEITLKSEILSRGSLDPFSASLLRNDVDLALIRQIYAIDGIYFRGVKFIQETVGQLTLESRQKVFQILTLDEG